MEKSLQYLDLINKRKTFDLPKGLINYAEAGFELEHVDGLEAWHSDLNARIMLIGQDFADSKAFIRDKGTIEPKETIFKYVTNKNLNLLFEKGLGIKIGHPLLPNKQEKLFFTNAIIGLKEQGGMQGELKDEWLNKSVQNFLKPLVELVQPKIIITLGKVPFQALQIAFEDKLSPVISKNAPLKDYAGKKFEVQNSIKVFPVYHPGSRGVNINRKLEMQIEDWKNIKQYLNA